MEITSQHRNVQLAERKRRNLEKKYGIAFHIIGRRNSRGQFSKRGTYFTFKSVTKKPTVTRLVNEGLKRLDDPWYLGIANKYDIKEGDFVGFKGDIHITERKVHYGQRSKSKKGRLFDLDLVYQWEDGYEYILHVEYEDR